MNTLACRLLLCLQFFVLILFAQRSREAGIFLGFSNYQGDLAPSPFAASEMRPAIGGVYRFLFTDHLALRATATVTQLSGADQNRPGYQLNERNWEMHNNLIELAVHPEWHFFPNARYGNTGLHHRQYSPFVSLGLGAVFGRVQLKVPSDDRSKIPETEANSTYLVIPISAGIRFDVSQDFLITAEFGSRATFSDYLDGVSINGNSKTKDWYFFAGLSFVYVIEEIVGGKSNW